MGSEKLTVQDRNEKVLVLFAQMESARTAGRTLRLPWRDLDLLWAVFGSVMDPAAAWAFGPIDEDENPCPDLPAVLSQIASAMLAEQQARRSALSTTTKGEGDE